MMFTMDLPPRQGGVLNCMSDLHQCNHNHASNTGERNVRRVECSSAVADTIDARSVLS